MGDGVAKPRSGYWIRFVHQECPACGGEQYVFQERIYDRPKPDRWNKRHIFEDYYDNCIEWAGLYSG